MGLYRVKLAVNGAQRIPAVMESLGMPVVRTEERNNGRHLYYSDPGTKKERHFWIAREGCDECWYCGLSSSAAKIADAFERDGIFEKRK